MDNPYSPPASLSNSQAAGSQSAGKLYSAGQVAWASFLGSPLAGCILMAINYRRLGRDSAVMITFASGVIGSCLLMFLAFCLPDGFPNLGLPLASTIGMQLCAKPLQDDVYVRHLIDGGERASSWGATAVGMLSFIVVIAALFGVLALMPDAWLMSVE